MTEMTSYPHGVPSWIDLATPDPDGAKAFYAELFGWEYEDQPTDQAGMTYTMARKDGKDAAGMMLLSSEMAESGMPPVWTSYISVDDLDAATAKVAPAGGTVAQPPMDVMDAGRMAVITDPTGATVALWEKKNHVGAGVANEHGAFSWNELISPDVGRAAEFYGEVLGWTSQTMPMPNGDYTVFMTDGGNENGIAGAMAPPMPGMPAFWGVYFQTDDAAATVAKAKELGAQVMMEATAMPGVGTLAALTDPQGAMFSLMMPEASS
jgi:predicted enzyme related to lactoylglutathione lyase